MIGKARDLCRRLGGDLIKVTEEQFIHDFYRHGSTSTFYEAPFCANLGINYHRKQIIYAVGAPEPSHLIHEMGHVFASKKRPPDSNEWTFLGWEICALRAIGLSEKTWLKGMEDYTIGPTYDPSLNGDEFGMIDAKQRRLVLAERVETAKKLKLVDLDGTPLSVRR